MGILNKKRTSDTMAAEGQEDMLDFNAQKMDSQMGELLEYASFSFPPLYLPSIANANERQISSSFENHPLMQPPDTHPTLFFLFDFIRNTRKELRAIDIQKLRAGDEEAKKQLIDVIGRRRCFLAGLGLQLAAHIYMAVYMSLQPAVAGNKPASDAAIASVFIYAVGWSIGLCTVQYLYGTEVFPTRIRSVSYASSMALHWFFQFAVVRVTPNMFVSLNVWGAYIFWALICGSGFIILGLWAPETKGVPMERMGELFQGHWWMGFRAKLGPRRIEDESAKEGSVHDEKQGPDARVERV